MRLFLFAAMLSLAAACTPPQTPADQADDSASNGSVIDQAPDPERDAMIAALVPAASDDIGRPVTFTVTTKRTEGDWGWLVAQPWTPEATQIDWSTTRYAEAAQEGLLDGNGVTYALLRRENGQWRVVAFAIGPTDAAWADWPQRYGAPASLMQAE